MMTAIVEGGSRGKKNQPFQILESVRLLNYSIQDFIEYRIDIYIYIYLYKHYKHMLILPFLLPHEIVGFPHESGFR